MIDAKDIRVGCWFEHNNQWSYRNEDQKYHYFQWEDRDWYAVGESTLSLDNISPIPLSPEVLIACGFQCHVNSNDFWTHFVLGNGWYISKSNHDEDSAGVMKDRFYWSDNYIEIKSLHQLQNLYYSLTSKEIEYKPK